MKRNIHKAILWLCIAVVVYVIAGCASAPPQKEISSSPRWEAVIQKFEARDQEQPLEPGGVVFIGSSSIAGWKTLKNDLVDYSGG